MAIYTADLHIHTVLSPCAEVEMIPPLIAAKAIERGLDMIAITDHNTAENAGAVIEAASGSSLKVIPGLECETVEGVHITCLFDDLQAAVEMQNAAYDSLPKLSNRPGTFGEQFVVDSDGEFIRRNERLLLAPMSLSITQAVKLAEELGGISIPAHVDRTAYGIYGVLGFMPSEPYFRAVEVSKHLKPEEALHKYADLKGRKIFCCSDAHRLEEIGSGITRLELRSRSVAEIKRWLME